MPLLQMQKAALQSVLPNHLKLRDVLGEGGNGRVYEARDSQQTKAIAVKFFLNSDPKRYQRFRDEVTVLTTKLAACRSVLPILDSNLPPTLSEASVAWYAMPVAIPLRSQLKGLNWGGKLQAFEQLARGLAEIHGAGVAHRDVKPENLFCLDDRYCFGDFGIADFDEKNGVTKMGEPMGPAGYIAPEMNLRSTDAESKPADVYSLAKCLWVVLRQKDMPFAGQYSRAVPLGLAGEPDGKDFTFEPLEQLLERCTSNNPADRPTAIQLAEELAATLELQGNWRKANPAQWLGVEESIVARARPARMEWVERSDICGVVREFSRRNALNHCFFPGGGGLDVKGAKLVEAGTMISLDLGEAMEVVLNPRRVTLERFSNGPEASYLVLESMASTKFNVRRADEWREYLWRLNDFEYMAMDEEVSAPDGAVNCKRYFSEAVFVIAPKAGVYNAIDSYEGNMNRMGRDAIRSRLSEVFLALAAKDNPPTNAVRLVNFPHLVRDVEQAPGGLQLKHLSLSTLNRLLNIERELCHRADRKVDFLKPLPLSLERANKTWTLLTAQTREEFSKLSLEAKEELLRLVEIGQGHYDDLRTVSQQPLGFALADFEDDDDYLMQKLGNGYLRRALNAYGCNIGSGGYVAPPPRDARRPSDEWVLQADALRARTEAKLRYAKVHLDELEAETAADGRDFDRAHQESFLFHLFGVRDAFLAELNFHYELNLPSEGLSPGKLRNELRRRGTHSMELASLAALEKDEASWYRQVKDLRDHSAHVQGVPRTFMIGGDDDGTVKLKNPRTGEVMNEHFSVSFRHWLVSMTALIKELRQSMVFVDLDDD